MNGCDQQACRTPDHGYHLGLPTQKGEAPPSNPQPVSMDHSSAETYTLSRGAFWARVLCLLFAITYTLRLFTSPGLPVILVCATIAAIGLALDIGLRAPQRVVIRGDFVVFEGPLKARRTMLHAQVSTQTLSDGLSLVVYPGGFFLASEPLVSENGDEYWVADILAKASFVPPQDLYEP